jgi:hypothetical protein
VEVSIAALRAQLAALEPVALNPCPEREKRINLPPITPQKHLEMHVVSRLGL